jgi:hypothetical protein
MDMLGHVGMTTTMHYLRARLKDNGARYRPMQPTQQAQGVEQDTSHVSCASCCCSS